MSDPLAVYLHDHLAGSRMAVDVLGNMRDQHDGEPLGRFAAALIEQIEEDRKTLREILERVGAPRSDPLKEAMAWLAEKLTRAKLRRRAGRGVGMLEALETVSLGILGKRALWRALAAVEPGEPRLRGLDFERLIGRAEAQHADVEDRRMEAARSVLPSRPSPRTVPGRAGADRRA